MAKRSVYISGRIQRKKDVEFVEICDKKRDKVKSLVSLVTSDYTMRQNNKNILVAGGVFNTV